MSDIEYRVAQGVALLDRVAPGWVDRINVDTLDVSHGGRCVLGQLYGLYTDGQGKLGLTMQQAADHGFQTQALDRSSDSLDWHRWVKAFLDNDYPALTDEWRRVIGILRQNTVATETTVELKELVRV